MNINDIHAIVKKILDKEDPLRLIEMGAPEDEYSMEIGEIAFRIVNKKADQPIQNIIKDVFKEQFDEETVKNYQNSLESIGNQIEEKIK